MSAIQDRSLLVLILDLTPKTFGERYQKKTKSDEVRKATNRSTSRPAVLQEILSSTLSFLIAFSSCHRDNTIVIVGVAGSEVAVIFPRKDRVEDIVGSMSDKAVDLMEMQEGLMLGMAELVGRSVQRDSDRCGTAIAAATSLALCIINRFMVSSTGGSNANGQLDKLHRKEDNGILSMISNKLTKEGESATKQAAEQRMAQRRARGLLSPRILIVQASEDNALDYNAFMNCVFAANKNDIAIDGCFLPRSKDDTSTFLEQACDRTGGVFSKPNNRTQVGGGLTEVFMTLFLPPLGIRKELNLPKINKVDFRARCFETGEMLDMGMVCNLCLSIFKNEPKGGLCLTCGAEIVVKSEDKQENGSGNEISAKKARIEN